jgi:hypothetical protein
MFEIKHVQMSTLNTVIVKINIVISEPAKSPPPPTSVLSGGDFIGHSST